MHRESTTVEQLHFEEALLQGGPYRRALPAALADASGCRVLESHGDQVGRITALLSDDLAHPVGVLPDAAQQQLRQRRLVRPGPVYHRDTVIHD